MIDQVRFFQRRGDTVRVYVLSPAQNVPDDVASVTRVVTLRELLEERHEHFYLSDLYIYHYPGRYALIESIRGIERGTVIFYYHNVTPPELWGSQVGRELLIESLEGSALVHYADLCITVSPFNKQDLVERLGYASDRIYVLPLAVRLDHLAPAGRDPELVCRYGLEGHRVLLYVGRMAGNKRIDLLVEALAQIKERVPRVKLLLVGDNQSNPAFHQIVDSARERAVELGVERDVIWTGRVDDLVSYYRLADVYVTASLHEGFGMPLIEAMACGVPIVASRAGAMPWVLDDAGLFCEPGDAGDLAEKVLRVLEDAELGQALVERGLERVQAFGLERYEESLADILDKVVSHTLPDVSLKSARTMAREERSSGLDAFRSQLILEMLADEIQAHSDVVLRDYEVRSGVPLLGPLIVWVRRNLTSHLREPYLDPIVERQVALNRRIAEWIARIVPSWKALYQRQVELEDRIKALEDQIEALLKGSDE
jgi:glycosyltransferase involved in cell wall biosynthesis